jgi:ferric-dicitrate binding protein FerR (iron transport regulator)
MHQDEERPSGDAETSERSVARLLKLSGERIAPSEEATTRAHAAALDAWQTSVDDGRSKNRRAVMWRLAAVVALFTIGAIVWTSFSSSLRPTRIVAHSVLVTGDVELIGAKNDPRAFAARNIVQVQSQLVTREGVASLSVGDSLSLRVNRHSRLRFDAENQITLLAGMIYVDSGGLSAHSDLRILTPAGEVRHEGTQYQVSVAAGETHIQVREGRVRLTNDDAGRSAHITSGEELDVDADGNALRRAIPSFGADWEWASALAAPLDTENRPLVEFLAWMAREHGWQLRYATPVLEREAQSIRLHGVAQGGTPEQTLHRVALITGLAMSVEDGVLVVSTREAITR